LPAETALAISLTKRVRELALGLPGLFVWHWIEGHHLLRRSEQPRSRQGRILQAFAASSQNASSRQPQLGSVIRRARKITHWR
jgi:hypothetical protein